MEAWTRDSMEAWTRASMVAWTRASTEGSVGCSLTSHEESTRTDSRNRRESQIVSHNHRCCTTLNF